MKKRILISLLVLVLCLAGCVYEGGEAQSTEQESQTESSRQTAETESDTATEGTQEIPNEPEEDYSKRY